MVGAADSRSLPPTALALTATFSLQMNFRTTQVLLGQAMWGLLIALLDFVPHFGPFAGIPLLAIVR